MKAKKLINLFIIVVVLGFQGELLGLAAFAADPGQPLHSDSRLRTYTYQPERVYSFTGHYTYQSRIDLDPNEEIASISLGDSTRWMIEPVGHRLFIKPIEFDATTNMTIITDKRTYYFELYAEEADGIDDPDLVFAAKFLYPNSELGGNNFMELDYDSEDERLLNAKVPDPRKEAQRLNFSYTMTGSRHISPIEIFDDGEFTYFRFRDKNAVLPAIFQVMPDGNEALINFRVEDGYVVVEMVTSQFTLRHGKQVACVYNETMPLEKTEPDDDDTSVFGIF